MIKQNWWKALGVIIIIYVLVAGMVVPLKPGIAAVAPSSVGAGETVELTVTGYNTFYKQSEDAIRAWLKLDTTRALQADRITVKSDTELEVRFAIPEYLPVNAKVQDFTLIIDNEVDGASVLPSAVFVTQDSIDPELAQQFWDNQPVEDLHVIKNMTYPFRNILGETIRNTYFHVSLWLAMVLLFIASVVYSIRYLRSADPLHDNRAVSFTSVGVLFGILGLITGAIWAKNTWGAYWSWDVKQNMTAIAMLIYFAYFILRGSFEDPERKGRIAAVYNIFAFVTLIPLIYVVPRMTDSLHPGAGGNPAFGSQDLDNTMRMVFYPAVIGWTLIGLWMANLLWRAADLRDQVLENIS